MILSEKPTSAAGRRTPTVIPTPHRATAGSSSCDTAEATHGDSLTVSPALPDNPSGIRYVTVTSDFLTCATVPVTPLITCTPDTQPGAPK